MNEDHHDDIHYLSTDSFIAATSGKYAYTACGLSPFRPNTSDVSAVTCPQCLAKLQERADAAAAASDKPTAELDDDERYAAVSARRTGAEQFWACANNARRYRESSPSHGRETARIAAAPGTRRRTSSPR